MVKDNFLELLVNLLLLPKDDVALSFYSLGFELGILQDVRQNVYGSRDIGIEGFGVIDGVFALWSVQLLPFPHGQHSY